jgi:DNA-binding PadR family transcriptional regulator
MASTLSKRRRQAKDVSDPKEASKVELVAATLFLIGGDTRFVLLDELALACHRLAPDTFCWPEFLWLPSLDSVRVTLVDVKRAGLVEEGSEKRGRTLKGIRLTQEGRDWAGRNERYLGSLRRRLPDPDRYMDRAEGELAAMAVLSASEGDDGRGVSRERAVAEAFRLFPERFALPQFAGWPDSARVEHAARSSSWVDISQREWTILSEHRIQVEKVRAELHVESREGFGASRRRQVMGTAHRAVHIIESTPLFQRFRRDQKAASISEDDVCDILAVTLESKPKVIQKHLDARIRLVEQAERWDLVEFLKFIGAWCAARDFNLTQ